MHEPWCTYMSHVLSNTCASSKVPLRFNKSANTDPQLNAAASPRVLVVRLPLRYVSPKL
jgi:hypothetical protein